MPFGEEAMIAEKRIRSFSPPSPSSKLGAVRSTAFFFIWIIAGETAISVEVAGKGKIYRRNAGKGTIGGRIKNLELEYCGNTRIKEDI